MRSIHFTKMHGLGNDYIYVNGFRVDLSGLDIPALARDMSDRHRGIGSDGLILIRPPARSGTPDEVGHVRMEMYNADGSRGEMCGNGIRCVAKYTIDHRLVDEETARAGILQVATDRGVLRIQAFFKNGRVDRVRVNMGAPILHPVDIPVKIDGEACLAEPIKVGNRTFSMSCVSMGNPHVVIFDEKLTAADLLSYGPQLEHHPVFPNRINVHFVAVKSRQEAVMQTWERGSGVTQACGTGACAVLVTGVLVGQLDRTATLHLPGGPLEIEWLELPGSPIGPVYMTGPATEVFSGDWPA